MCYYSKFYIQFSYTKNQTEFYFNTEEMLAMFKMQIYACIVDKQLIMCKKHSTVIDLMLHFNQKHHFSNFFKQNWIERANFLFPR